jgi:hypothetical protein
MIISIGICNNNQLKATASTNKYIISNIKEIKNDKTNK